MEKFKNSLKGDIQSVQKFVALQAALVPEWFIVQCLAFGFVVLGFQPVGFLLVKIDLFFGARSAHLR